MGMWENLKNLANLGSNLVKAGGKALNVLDKISDRKVINYRVPDMVPESDQLTSIENMYVATMKSAIMKMVLEEYDSGRLDLEWLYKYLKDSLETLVAQIEVNYKYRKDVLRLDFAGDDVDHYMNSSYFLKSDCSIILTQLNKLIDHIRKDINKLNDKSFKAVQSRETILDILTIE